MHYGLTIYRNRWNMTNRSVFLGGTLQFVFRRFGHFIRRKYILPFQIEFYLCTNNMSIVQIKCVWYVPTVFRLSNTQKTNEHAFKEARKSLITLSAGSALKPKKYKNEMRVKKNRLKFFTDCLMSLHKAHIILSFVHIS